MELILLILVYMIPSIIAGIRHHHSGWAIMALNVLLGWTVLGWLISFIWSLTGVRKEAHT